MTQHNLIQNRLEELQTLLQELESSGAIQTYLSQRREVSIIEWGKSLIRLGSRPDKPLQLVLLEGQAQDYYALYHALQQPPIAFKSKLDIAPPYWEQHRLLQDPDFLARGWSALFPEDYPLALELGCGYGHFLAEYAVQKELNFLGLDIVSKVLRRAHKRLKDLDNVQLAKLDGIFLLREWIMPQSLQELFILFPDPWPKDRHQNRRSVRPDTLKLLASALKVDGRFIFVSDDPPYAQQVTELLDNCPYFESETFPDLVVRTKYERKWRQQNKDIYHLAYRRKAHSDLAVPRPWQAIDPHGQMQLEYFDFQALQDFQEPLLQDCEDLTVKINDVYLNANSALLRVIIAESGAMAQSLWMKVSATGQLQVCPYSALPFMARQASIFQAIHTLLTDRKISHVS